MKQNNHNTHFYSIQEVERCLKSTEEFEDGEQLFYFIGALRYVYDENKKKDKEIERLKNGYCELKEKCNNGECDCTNEEYDGMAERNMKLSLEVERLNNIIKIMEKYFELIIDLGYDYDGLNQEESLKKLIDELCRYASLGRVYNTTEPIYTNENKKYNILNEELKESGKK